MVDQPNKTQTPAAVGPVQKYCADFHGRLKGAIGIFHRCSSFTEGDTPEAAQLALYDHYEHISGVRLTPLVQRYVPTYQKPGELRSLMGPAQGRHTFDTAEGAERWLALVKSQNTPDGLQTLWGDPQGWEVRPVWCWPGHFDPVGVYFD